MQGEWDEDVERRDLDEEMSQGRRVRLPFFTWRRLGSVAMILAIVAAAQAVVLITRNVDVSVGSMMGFAAFLTADFAANNPGVGPVLILMPLAIGIGLGAINGLLVAYGQVSSLIATLGTMSLYRGLTYIYAGGQEVTSSRLPRWMIEMVDMRIGMLPFLAIISVVGVAVLAVLLG